MSKEAMKLALKRAFVLGQDYWYQADHESYRQNKKADETLAKFRQLVDETCEALAKPDFWEGYVPEPVKPRGEATLAQQEPVEVKQIAEALRQIGLTLVRTGGSFRVMDLGRIEAQATSPPAQRTWVEVEQVKWEGDRLIAKLKEKNT